MVTFTNHIFPGPDLYCARPLAPEVELRTQGSRPRPTTQKNFEAKAKDQGHRRKCSPKKKGFQKNFSGKLKKKVFKNFFQAINVFKNFFSGDLRLRKTKKGLRKFSARFLAFSNKISTVQKLVLSSSRGQANFRGLEALRPRPKASKFVLEDVFEAKDVLNYSISAWHFENFCNIFLPKISKEQKN